MANFPTFGVHCCCFTRCWGLVLTCLLPGVVLDSAPCGVGGNEESSLSFGAAVISYLSWLDSQVFSSSLNCSIYCVVVRFLYIFSEFFSLLSTSRVECLCLCTLFRTQCRCSNLAETWFNILKNTMSMFS